ncbi:MAG TPA: methyltransferase [Deltaproteobacteria bacterium]|nr:methyltransferase [Deltaproteobacteria bacterium]
MKCRVCDSSHLEPALDLGNQPWANHFLKKEEVGKEPFYPLRVLLCLDCGTSQLDYTVKKEVMFADHTYLSGVTRTLSEHFRNVAVEVDDRFFRDRCGKSVLDIGSNDGTQLKHFQALGYDVLGVESSRIPARVANDAGIPTLKVFFNLETAKGIGRTFDVINAAGIFFHLEELHSFTDGVRELLGRDGVFVVQFLYMKSIMENLAFDQIYHEHLLYYNVNTVERLLRRHGLALFDAYLSPIHGGSIVGFVGHRDTVPPASDRLEALRQMEIENKSNELETYRAFDVRVRDKKREILERLDGLKAGGKRICGFGAPVKGNTLLNYCGIGTQYLDCLVEKNELRRGLYSPGMHIPVRIEKELESVPDAYFVLAWNFKKEILENNRPLVDNGVEFYFPIEPREVV